MANDKLSRAKEQKNDEFYTQYSDIQKEMNAYIEFNPDVFRNKTILCPCDDPEWSNFTKFFAQNFETFGLKKLISTSYAVESKAYKEYQPTLFETESPLFCKDKTRIKGKIFTLDRDTTKKGKIDIQDLKWNYLEGDGDFRSQEVIKLREEADIIITNPPFSLFHEFFLWLMESQKSFIIIGNLNALKYIEVFPYIKNNKIWFGSSYFNGGAAYFIADKKLYNPDKMSNTKNAFVKDGKFYWRVNGVRWYTNIDHGRRHEPLSLMSMADNIKFSKHKELKNKGYQKYFNYDGIDVPYIDAIPNDYNGVMGVPISFLDKYNPDQFEIIGKGAEVPKKYKHESIDGKIIVYKDGDKIIWETPYTVSERKIGNSLRFEVDGKPGTTPYERILIKRKDI